MSRMIVIDADICVLQKSYLVLKIVTCRLSDVITIGDFEEAIQFEAVRQIELCFPLKLYPTQLQTDP